jgi:HPt (histidine-containing phosphotransfer) domain-containing protein
VESIEAALRAGEAGNLARAAHAWRSYNGNVGAHALAQLCRELESHARGGDLAAAAATFAQIRVLHGRVRDELRHEMRRSA